MGKKFKKILSTVVLLSMLSPFSGCVSEVATTTDNVVYSSVEDDDLQKDNQSKIESENKNNEVDSSIDSEIIKDESVDSSIDSEIIKDESADSIAESNITTDNSNSSADDVEKEDEIDIEKEDIGSKYWDTNQVKQILESLGAKSEHIFKYDPLGNDHVVRFAHNNGEPLKVAFAPTVSEDVKLLQIEALNEMFFILNSVNDNYKYEIVEYNPNNKADITFINRELFANGAATHSFKDISKDTEMFTINAEVYINENALLRAYGTDKDLWRVKTKHVVVHELEHALFNLADVYLSGDNVHTSDEYNALTLLYSSYGNNEFTLTHITPNDFKNAIALYAKPSDNLEEDIIKYKQMVEDYEQFYYAGWAEAAFKEDKLPAKNIENGTYTFSRNVWVDRKNKIQIKMNFSITVNDDKYEYIVSDPNGNILESASGEIKYLSLLNEDGTNLDKAVAVFANFESKRIFEDIGYSNVEPSDIKNGWLNLVLYNDGEKIVIKDVLDSINRAKSVEFLEIEKEPEK